MIQTKVCILYTGGTIGMAPKDTNDPYSPLEPKPLTDLLGYTPGFKSNPLTTKTPEAKYRSQKAQDLAQSDVPFLELSNGNIIEFGHKSFDTPVDSSCILPSDWTRIANMIEEVYNDYDGFVILHGTDTMAFTSSALSFMLENLAKPVVVTGSQLPIASIRTDAVLNFVNAIYIAGYRAADLPLIPEVIIVFADKIIRGCRATKVSSSEWAGFDSPNFPLLGHIGEHININPNYVLPPPVGNKKLFVKSDFNDHVFNINVFPGFTDALMRKIFLDEDTAGIIMRTYGAGNVPDNANFLEIIESAVNRDKLIVNITQCQQGTVEMGLYEASSGLLERGVLSGLDMTPEAALTKLMWTLGTQFGQGRITQMQISQRGEQTENLFDLRFGEIKEREAKDSYTNAVSPDGRLDRDRISRAMLRISGLGIIGAEKDDRIRIRAYMNMPSAKHSTKVDEERCVGMVEFKYDEKESIQTRMQNITYKTQNVIGSGEVILTLIADKAVNGEQEREFTPVKVYCKGLYIAVYAKAEF